MSGPESGGVRKNEEGEDSGFPDKAAKLQLYKLVYPSEDLDVCSLYYA
jgi:hypothetical protein